MINKIKSGWKFVTAITMIVMFIITFLGGLVYYYDYTSEYSILMYFAIVIQNTFKMLCFNPILGLEDLVKGYDTLSAFTGWKQLIMNLYCLVAFIAPAINLMFVLSILDGILHFFVGFRRRGKRVLIIGYNEQVKRMLDTKVRKNKVHLWVNKTLTTEEERSLYFSGVVVKRKDYVLNQSEVEKDKRYLNKFSYILLWDESDVLNMQNYMLLANIIENRKETTHFWVNSNKFENRQAVQDYFDSKLEETAHKNIDLRIVNFAQIQAEKLFEKMSGKFVAEKDGTMHGLIIGAGQLGEHVLLHAMNQNVVSPNNKIIIDVIDNNVNNLKKRLLERFDESYVKYNSKCNEFQIEPGNADGSLSIRLHNIDIYDENFYQNISNLQKKDETGMFSYIAICIPDVDANMRCALQIEKADLLSGDCQGIPVALRMTHSNEMEQFFERLKIFGKGNVYMIGARKEVLPLDEIINEEEEKQIRKYHATYERFSVQNSLSKEEDVWNRLKYYKREANRALFHHRTVKENSFIKYKDEINRFWSETEKIEGSNRCLALSEKMLKYNNLVTIAKTEHRRFCYFQASEGWGYTEGKKDEDKRLHDCLCTWDKLVETKKDVLIYDLISAPNIMGEYDK